MPFSEQQVYSLFHAQQPGVFLDSAFTRHPNYPIVTGYLTGTTQSLGGLTAEWVNYGLQSIVHLLEDINPPSANDQLALDVLTHPNVYPCVQNELNRWLVYYAASHNTTAAVGAAANYLKQTGHRNHEIFFLFTLFLQHFKEGYKELLQPDSAIKNYLLSILPASLNVMLQQPAYTWNYGWNSFLFLLFEDVAPHLAKEYLLFTLSSQHADITTYVLDYQQGKYIPFVIDWLISPSNEGYEFDAKIVAAVRFYQKEETLFKTPALQAAQNYLENYRRNMPSEKWERHLHMPFPEAQSAYICYSAAAIHLLALHNLTAATTMVQEWFQNKVIVSFDVLQLLAYHLKEDVLPFLKAGLKTDASLGGISYYRKIIQLLTSTFKTADYGETLWELTSTKSKPLRAEIAKLLADKGADAEQRAIQLLQSKNVETRQTAAQVLSYFPTQAAITAVNTILNTETNDNARDLLLQIAAASLPARADAGFVAEMVAAAAARGKLAKPLVPWLNEQHLPPLYYLDGRQLSPTEVRFLFYRMSRVKAMRSDIEARYLIEQLDKERSGTFARHIIQLFIEKGEKPENKYLLALAALLGGDETADALRKATNGWIEIYRTKMAEYGIGALALQGGNKALRLVEYYSRKYKNKTASVGAAATQALEDAAEELNISTHELGDRIVPDFGFDGLFRHFEIGSEEYRAFIDSNFKLAFFDEDNTKLKALPAAADAAIKNEFKNVVKEVREVVKAQSLRLEYYLVTQRRWSSEEWQRFYLTNPVMFIYATRLVWGRYNSLNQLTDCFLCLDDTSLTDITDEEITLDEGERIGIVHPAQLPPESLAQWRKKLYDASILPIFPQLDRSITLLEEKDRGNKIYAQFDGREAAGGTIKPTLEKYGWQKGPAGDGGYIDHFIYENKTAGINGILEVEGVFAGGFSYDAEPKLGRLYFVRLQKEKQRWFSFPKDEQDKRLIAFGEVEPIFYAEVTGSLQHIRPKEKQAPANPS